MKFDSQLVIPEIAKADRQSFEILRVWISNGTQHVSLRVGVWNNPQAWGIMLADLARHIANSFDGKTSVDRLRVLELIKQGLYAELEGPTDEPSGATVD